VVPPEKVGRLRVVTIALDACCGDLRSMQTTPGADWLEAPTTRSFSPK
jgi:hypothetical protein